MAKRKTSPPQRNTAGMSEYRIDGPEGFSTTRKQPSDEIALSWAIGVLSFRAGDDRPGEATPFGDFTLTFIGGATEEALYRMRKIGTAMGTSRSASISWEAA